MVILDETIVEGQRTITRSSFVLERGYQVVYRYGKEAATQLYKKGSYEIKPGSRDADTKFPYWEGTLNLTVVTRCIFKINKKYTID